MPPSSASWFTVSGVQEGLLTSRSSLRLYDRIIPLQYLQLAFVLTDEGRARTLSRLDGIPRVQPISQNRLKIIVGIERVLYDGRRACNTLQPNGWAQDIPSLPGDPDGESSVPFYPYYAGDLVRVLDSDTILQTRLGFMAAISLSLAAPRGEEFDPNDPINLATHAASQYVPIVMAAGNYGPAAGDIGTMSAWARAPWVISVGATDAEDGGKLAVVSSRGSPNEENSGPTVVAWGRSGHPDPNAAAAAGIRTSFAAPKVASALAWLAAYCLTVRHYVQVCREKDPKKIEGIPLTGFGTVDDGFRDEAWVRPEKLPALPRAGIDAVALEMTLRLLESKGCKVELWPTPDRLKLMLLECAQPLRGYRHYEIGQGFVSPESVMRYLVDFTGADFCRLFCVGEAPIDDIERDLGRLRLTDAQALPGLFWHWEASRRGWRFGMMETRMTFASRPRRFLGFECRRAAKNQPTLSLDDILDSSHPGAGKINLMHL